MSDKDERFDLSMLTCPEQIKELSSPALISLSSSIREEIISCVSNNGGHLSPNLGVVELTLAMYRVFNFPKDKLIFDVGHQCYTHKLLSGRKLDSLNQKDGVTGFQNINESIFDPYSAGHSSTAISAAEAFAFARDKKGENYDIIAVCGDASISNGLSFEALNDIGGRRKKIIIVLNDNGMSIAKPVGGLQALWRNFQTGKAYNKAVSKYRKKLFENVGSKGRFTSFAYSFKNTMKKLLLKVNMFDNLGFAYLGPIDGHNIKKMEDAFKRAKNTPKPVIVHVLTKKGKGYAPAENDTSGYWHGVTPFDITTGKPKNTHPDQMSWSHYFADLTLQIMQSYDKAMLLVPATQIGSDMDIPFSRFKERCIDLGIAEEHTLTFAGALALNDIHPIVSIYSTFLQRAYDELSHDVARLNVNMTILIDRAGLIGPNGETHQGIYDEAYLKSIPNLILAMPSNKAIAKALYFQSMEDHGVFAIRYPREMVFIDEEVEDIHLELGRWKFARRSKDYRLALIAVGPAYNEIRRLLDEENIDCELIDPIYLNPINPNDIEELRKYEKVFIYDAYATKTGFCESVLSGLLEHGYTGKVGVRAIDNVFVKQASIEEQKESFFLLPSQILEDIKAFIN